MENFKDETGPESGQEKPPRKDYLTRFTKDNQPSGAVKSMGWWKKQKGRKMLKALLELPFDGGLVKSDPLNPNSPLIPNPVKRQAAQYFGMPEELVTVEMIMAMKQLALAIQKNDTSAFNSTWEKAYGKPKEEIDAIDIPPPVINMYVIESADMPEIKETEHDTANDTDQVPSDSNGE